jgi:IS5 family transposase
MIVTCEAQKPFPFGGLAGDELHIYDKDLACIDEILRDPEFYEVLREAILRNSPQNAFKGPKRTAVNRVLRLFILKHIKNWSFRQLYTELQRNLDYRAFTQFFDEKIPDFSTFCRNFALIDELAIRQINDHLRDLAIEKGIIQGKKLRTDTTVCENNIHHPTDNSLLQDGVRVLTRIVRYAEEILPSLGRMRDRSRSVLRRVLQINQSTRTKGKAAESSKRQRERSYRSLMRITRSVVSDAQKVVRKLSDRRVTRHLSFMDELSAQGLRDELQTMTPRVDTVIKQTRARICHGDTQFPGKLLSIFEPEAAPIRKGKAHKPTEFGRLVEIDEVERGFVSDFQLFDGNPSDVTMLIPAIDRHKNHFGRPPKKVATDRGFWSLKNEEDAYSLGVKRVSIPIRGGKLSEARRVLQRTRWFRSLQRWRAGGEGRIGTLKTRYGLDRSMYKGNQGMHRWVGGCVLANNLVVMARQLQKASHCDSKATDQAQGQDTRQAA